MELTKVYVVQAVSSEEYEDYKHWTEGVFASEESAKKYISDEKSRYDEDMRRIDELEKLRSRRHKDGTYDSFEKWGWTAEEFEEYEARQGYWSKAWGNCPHYWTRELEVKD